MAEASAIKQLSRAITWATVAILLLTLVLILRKSPPPNVPTDPQAAARAQQKFQAAAEAKASGQAAHVQLDSSELNSFLAQNLELKPQQGAASPSAGSGGTGAVPAATNSLPSNPSVATPGGNDQPTLEEVQSSVKDVKVDMEGDLVKAYVVFDFHGKDLSMELDGHLSAEGGYLHFEPVSGKLGSMPLPQSALASAVEKMMASPENREKLKLPEGVNGIKIVDGQVVLDYK
jgi:hypothetical protein